MNRSILLAGLLVAGCTQAPAGRPPVTESQARQVAEAAEATFTAGDAGRIMTQYAPGAVMIDSSAAEPSVDRKVQEGWTRNLVSMQPADFKVPDRHIQIVGPDAFVSSGTATFTVAAGAARPTVAARFTDVFQRQKDGAWKIVNEHVSMPPTPAPAPAP